MKTMFVGITGIMVFASIGCISDPKFVEEDFGRSVQQMVQAQIYDPAAASNPEIDPPLLLDGGAGSESVEGYREASKRPKNDTDNRNVNIRF